MTTEHTQGLLVVGEPCEWRATHEGLGNSCFTGIGDSETGEIIALAVARDEDFGVMPDCRPAARRIVACWNKLSIWTTEEIESGVASLISMDDYAKSVKSHNALVAQRDAVLAAIARLTDAAFARDTTMGDQCALFAAQAELRDATKVARAAIAKATGSAT